MDVALSGLVISCFMKLIMVAVERKTKEQTVAG